MNQNIHYCTKEETLLGEMQQKQEMYQAKLEMYVHINIRVIKIQCTQTK